MEMMGIDTRRWFVAGDVRANQNIALTAMHTLFVREHNRRCDELKRIFPDATDEQIYQAALDTIPNVAAMFWSFRIMVGLGFYMLALIALSFYFCAKRVFDRKRWVLKVLLFSLPAPWIAIELGWFVAEYGRQPWTIGGVLPTFLSPSSLTAGDLIGSLIIIIALYTVFLIVEMYLMTKYVRLGPSSLHTGRYHFEQEKV